MKLFDWIHKFSVKASLCWLARVVLFMLVMAIAFAIGWFLGSIIPPIVTGYAIVILGTLALFGVFYLFFQWSFSYTLIPVYRFADNLILRLFGQRTLEEEIAEAFEGLAVVPAS